MSTRRTAWLSLLAATVAAAGCSAIVDFSGLTGPAADADATSDGAAPVDALASTSDGARAASCTPGSCANENVCCAAVAPKTPLDAVLDDAGATCVPRASCTTPRIPIECTSSDFCAASFDAGDVCCVSHDKASESFLSAFCTAFVDCHTSGPQDILCDPPDAAICGARTDDAGDAAGIRQPVCKPIGVAGDGTNFADVAICF